MPITQPARNPIGHRARQHIVAVGTVAVALRTEVCRVGEVDRTDAGRGSGANDALCGLVVESASPSDRSFRVVRRLWEAGVRCPILAVTTADSVTLLANEWHLRGAHLVHVHDVERNVAVFCRSCVRGISGRDAILDATLQHLRDAFGLSEEELHIVELTIGGVARADLARQLGVNPDTLKSRVRRLLTKCNVNRLDGVFRLAFEALVA